MEFLTKILRWRHERKWDVSSTLCVPESISFPCLLVFFLPMQCAVSSPSTKCQRLWGPQSLETYSCWCRLTVLVVTGCLDWTWWGGSWGLAWEKPARRQLSLLQRKAEGVKMLIVWRNWTYLVLGLKTSVPVSALSCCPSVSPNPQGLNCRLGFLWS